MDHGRLPARIHVTGTHRNVHFFLCFPTDTFHIRSQKRIHTGDADHHHRRLLLTAVADLFYRFGDLFQMTACDNICLAHHQVKKTVIILRHGTDKRSISSTASGRHDQHNGIRHCKPRTFYPEAFRSRRIKCQRCRRTVDQMGMRNQLSGNILFSQFIQLFYRTKISFLSHAPSSSFHSSAARSKKHLLILEVGSPSITVFPCSSQ